jgi:hypothetical protein
MQGDIEALMKPDPAGGTAVLFVNLGTGEATGHFALSQFGVASGRATAHDVWTGETAALSEVSVTLEAGQTSLLHIKGR